MSTDPHLMPPSRYKPLPLSRLVLDPGALIGYLVARLRWRRYRPDERMWYLYDPVPKGGPEPTAVASMLSTASAERPRR